MNKSKYLPIHQGNNYYIYDCLRKWIYPCSKVIYEHFFNNKQKEKEDFDFSNREKKEILKFTQMISLVNKNMKKGLFAYPEIQKDEVINSLSRVPHITLEITEACNLDCVYCCYGNLYKKNKKGKNNGKKEDILYYLKTLLDLRNQHNIKSDLHITFYGGEPLLRFDIIKACVKLSHNILPNVKVTFGITTNGVLLHHYVEYLIEHNFSLLISIDGNKNNDEYRVMNNGEESFPLVERNIEKLFQEYHDYFVEKVSFSTVLHHKNSYIEATEFFSKWGKVPVFSMISSLNAKENNKLYQEVSQQHQYSVEEISNFKKNFPDASKEILPPHNNNMSAWLDTTSDVFERFNEILKEEKYIFPSKCCFLFSSRVFVSVKGNIYLCEKSSRNFLFGKIVKKGFIIYLKRINQYYSNITEHYQHTCSLCYKSYSCSKCFFSNYDEIEIKKCFCSREEAIKELNLIINPEK